MINTYAQICCAGTAGAMGPGHGRVYCAMCKSAAVHPYSSSDTSPTKATTSKLGNSASLWASGKTTVQSVGLQGSNLNGNVLVRENKHSRHVKYSSLEVQRHHFEL